MQNTPLSNFERSDLCQGMPAGYESPCGIIHDPHGPHPLPPTVTSMSVNQRIDGMGLTEQDMSFVLGWLSSSDPRKLDDALDALETYRIRRKR
jgi:hypothetical protein